MNHLLDAAYAVPAVYDVNSAERFEVVGGKLVIKNQGQHSIPRDTEFGPSEVKGGLVQYFGPHRESLTAAGFHLVDSIAEVLPQEKK